MSERIRNPEAIEEERQRQQPEQREEPREEPQQVAEPEERHEPEKPEEKPESDTESSWRRRLERETREKYEARREAEQLRRQWEALQAQQRSQQNGQDPVEVAKAQLREEQRTAQFNEACNRVFSQGQQEYPNFGDEVAALASVGQAQDPQAFRGFLEAVASLENGHAVYHRLAQNLGEAESIMRLSPMQMGMRLMRLGEEAKSSGPAANPLQSGGPGGNGGVSRAPAPTRSVGGNSRQPPTRLDQMSMADFVRARDKEEWQRRRGG